MLNKLLLRQVKKFFGELEGLPENLKGFISAINETYQSNEQDRVMLERVLELSSSEMIDLNDKLRSETEEVRRTHDELQTLFKNMDVVFFSADVVNNKLLQISPACEEVYGYPIEDHYKNSNLWYDVILEEDRHIIESNYPVMYAGHSFTQVYRIRHANGNIRWLETKISPSLDSSGKVTRIDGFTYDITARKEAEEKAENTELKFKLLIENSEDIITLMNRDRQIVYGSPSISKRLGYTLDEYYSLNPFDLIHPEDIQECLEKFDFALNNPGEAIYFTARVRKKDGEYIYTEGTRTNLFHIPEINALVTNFRNITLRKEAEKQVKVNEIKFKALIENSHDGIAMVGVGRKLLYVTPSIQRIMGYSPEELIGADPGEYTHPDDLTQLLAKLEELAPKYGETIQAEYRMKNNNGEYRWLRSNITNMLHEPALEAIIVNYEDITEVVKAQAQLEFDRNNTTALINSTADLMWSVDADVCLITANNHFIEAVKVITGHELKTGDGILFESGFSRKEMERWKERYEQVLTTGETLTIEDYFNMNGYESWIEINMNPITENNKVIGVACFSRDISERKQTEILLLENQKMLAEAQRVARFGSWEMTLDNISDIDAAPLKWSDEVFRIFGFEPGEVEVSNQLFTEMVHPEDREMVSETFRNALKNSDTYQVEHRIVLRTGEEKIVYEQAEIIRDKNNNKALKIIGTVQDITERKKAEQSLKQAEANLRNILENTDTSYILLDREAYIVSFNNQASEMAVRELGGKLRVGENYLERMSPERRKHLMEAIETVLNEKRQVTYEVEYKKPSGQSMWLYVRLHPIINENSTVPGLSIAATDITERKLAEQVLKQAEANLRNLLENTDTSYILLDKNATVLLMNRLAENLTANELKHDVTVGKSYIQAMPAERQEAVKQAIDAVLKEGRQISYEVEYKNIGKPNLWLHVRMHPIIHDNHSVEGLSIAATDITERKNAEKQLQESYERYKIVTKATNDVIWDWDIVNDHMYRSENYALVFGKTRPEDLLEKNWITNIHPGDRQRIIDSVSAKINDPTSILWEDEYRYYRSNGEIAYIHDRGYILRDDANQPVRMVGAMADVTAAKLIELQNQKITEDLLHRNKDLEQFAYIVSHNLRVPVANLMGFADALKYEGISIDDKQQFIEGMEQSARRLDEVVRDLNVILQVQKKFDEQKEVVKLSELVEAILVSINQTISHSGLQLEIDFEVDEIVTLKSYLHSIFLNLISNAIKYRRPDTDSFLIIKSYTENDKLILSFKDNGLGINLEKRGDQVFGLYKRFHHHIEGKGVGLYMVKKQVETLGGKITLNSKENEGTEFLIEFGI